MAYAAEVTVDKATISGRRHWIITVSETDAAAASEYEVDGLPALATLRLTRTTLTAGAGATVAPVLGNATGFAVNTQAHLASYDTPASHINDATAFPINLPTGKLVVRSTVNTGADNAISTVFVLVEGVQD